MRARWLYDDARGPRTEGCPSGKWPFVLRPYVAHTHQRGVPCRVGGSSERGESALRVSVAGRLLRDGGVVRLSVCSWESAAPTRGGPILASYRLGLLVYNEGCAVALHNHLATRVDLFNPLSTARVHTVPDAQH